MSGLLAQLESTKSSDSDAEQSKASSAAVVRTPRAAPAAIPLLPASGPALPAAPTPKRRLNSSHIYAVQGWLLPADQMLLLLHCR
jgi:hypothetical protein